MADSPVIVLNRNWRVICDSRQWIIQQRAGTSKDGAEKWAGRKFVPTTAADLRRTIAKLRIKVSPGAARELERLPATFGQFLEQHGVDRPAGDMRSERYHRERDRLREKRAVSTVNKPPHSDVGDGLVGEERCWNRLDMPSATRAATTR